MGRLGVGETLDAHWRRHGAVQCSVPLGEERSGWQPLEVTHWGLGVGNTLKSPERMSVVRDHWSAFNIPGRCGDNQPARHLLQGRGETEQQEHCWGHHHLYCRAELSRCWEWRAGLLIFLQLSFLLWPVHMYSRIQLYIIYTTDLRHRAETLSPVQCSLVSSRVVNIMIRWSVVILYWDWLQGIADITNQTFVLEQTLSIIITQTN